jgi:hypothetical protein
MRRRQIRKAICFLLLLPILGAPGGGNDKGKPSVKVTGSKVGLTRATEGHPTKWPAVDGCTASTKEFPVYGPDPKDPAKQIVVGTNKVKGASCPSINSGVWFPWADQCSGCSDGEGTLEAVDGDAPTPTFQTEGKWYTQRYSYYWIPANWAPPGGGGVTIRLYGKTSKRDYGFAVLRAVNVRFDYGNQENIEECPAEQAVKPYKFGSDDPQEGCPLAYWVSSLADGRSFTADGTYHPRVKIFWKIVSASINGFAVDPNRLPGLVPESSSAPGFYKVPVYEIQTLVTCKEPNDSCLNK